MSDEQGGMAEQYNCIGRAFQDLLSREFLVHPATPSSDAKTTSSNNDYEPYEGMVLLTQSEFARQIAKRHPKGQFSRRTLSNTVAKGRDGPGGGKKTGYFHEIPRRRDGRVDTAKMRLVYGTMEDIVARYQLVDDVPQTFGFMRQWFQDFRKDLPNDRENFFYMDTPVQIRVSFRHVNPKEVSIAEDFSAEKIMEVEDFIFAVGDDARGGGYDELAAALVDCCNQAEKKNQDVVSPDIVLHTVGATLLSRARYLDGILKKKIFPGTTKREIPERIMDDYITGIIFVSPTSSPGKKSSDFFTSTTNIRELNAMLEAYNKKLCALLDYINFTRVLSRRVLGSVDKLIKGVVGGDLRMFGEFVMIGDSFKSMKDIDPDKRALLEHLLTHQSDITNAINESTALLADPTAARQDRRNSAF